MKNLLFLLLVLLFIPTISSAQITLFIEIETIRNNNGQILLEFNSETEEVVKGISEKIAENKCIITVENLKPGNYAFKYFHDENMDEKINTNFMGLPREGYGFSNNAKGKFGPPTFDKMIFEVTHTDTIKCTPTYILKQK
ncbi:DUF2141 domain-containing protein [Prolixibacteraceae bacterium Z1-6]|uniref:DUF2141 domain-containing protein n=1 Tax=Draconibacterium aestuarii TaxID=2998507 RepID=A0A9X3FA79_9BACT|nr:DUF2141 domain-containing protein [Prolixibacteraceae bacterium Z1-6]